MKNIDNHPLSVLVTGAGGYIGRQVVAALAVNRRRNNYLIATDIRLPANKERLPNVEYSTLDIRSPKLLNILRQYSVQSVVHLAAIVTPEKHTSRDHQFSVDVLGTNNVLECCHQAGVKHLVITSSGAAYGYHADNPEKLNEEDKLRGNVEFAYSDHKRQVEENLEQWRHRHPQLKQLIFRSGAILGESTTNQITALFERPFIVGLTGVKTNFTFIWDQDVVNCIVKGVHEQASGIFNLAGDGTISMRQIARRLGKPYIPLPVRLVTSGLWLLKQFRLTRYGPEQVRFLRYRPSLCNKRLKEQFGYTPGKTSQEVFELFVAARRR